MERRFRANQIEIVLKITKYCNLRCAYCYEYPHLGDKRRVSLDQFAKLFANFGSFTPASIDEDGDLFSFIWHGGEPFMVQMAYYDAIGQIQSDVIGDRFRYHNSVQTNLTILTESHLDALEERRFFHALGFSFDVYGDDRRDIHGRPSTEKVLKNVQSLLDRKIPAGAIGVLSRATYPHIKSIFKFYDRLGINLRILPFHIEAVTGQKATHGLSPQEIATGMCAVFDLWLASERPIKLYPLDIYLRNALNYMNGATPYVYDQDRDESVFIVNTDGAVTGYESYLDDEPYGNVFEQSFEEIVYSPSRKHCSDAATQRVERFCARCPYFGACSGFPAASANALEAEWFSADACYVSMVTGHIVRRLDECGLGIAHAEMAQASPASNEVLALAHD